MATTDPRMDAYIAKANAFAKPILTHLRKLIHTACPEVVETMKWSMPHFEYKGLLCGMAAFKGHCTFGFWKGDLLFAEDKSARKRADEAMGNFGRITSLADLPSAKVLMGYVKAAMKLNDSGAKRETTPRRKVRTELVIPDDLQAALRRNPKALTAFENFSYSHKKEYVEWITEAKRDETRKRRLAMAVDWLAKGKSKNWKYENCG